MSQLEKLPPDNRDYYAFLILYLSSYFLADQTVYFLTVVIPSLFVPITEVLDQATIPLFITVFVLVFARVFSTFLPALNIEIPPHLLIVFAPVFVLVHPVLLNISGTRIIAVWILLTRIEAGGLFLWLLETVILLFGAFGIYLIATRQRKDVSGVEGRYIEYLGKDIFNALIVFLVIYYLVRSFILEQFEGIEITMPIKLLLVYLLVIIVEPIQESE